MHGDRDVSKLADAEHRLDTPSGRMLQKMLLAVFGAVVVFLLTTINVNMTRANDLARRAQTTADAARDTNYSQERDLALLKVRTDSIERKTDATVSALQALTLQVTRNGDVIDEHHGREK